MTRFSSGFIPTLAAVLTWTASAYAHPHADKERDREREECECGSLYNFDTEELLRGHGFGPRAMRLFTKHLGPPRLGVELLPLTPGLRKHFGVKKGAGILVSQVMEGRPAERAGLKAGDIIVRVNGDAVASSEDIIDALDDKKEGQEVALTVVRSRKRRVLKAKLDKPPAMFERVMKLRGMPPRDSELRRKLERAERRLQQLEARMRKLEKR